MRAQNLSTWLGEGRDAAPSLALPSPKTKPGRLHKRIDTPGGSQQMAVPTRSTASDRKIKNGDTSPRELFNLLYCMRCCEGLCASRFEIYGRADRLRQYYIRKFLLVLCGYDDRVIPLVSYFEIVVPLAPASTAIRRALYI